MKRMKKKLLIICTCLLLLLTSCGPEAGGGAGSSDIGTGPSSVEELPTPTSSLSVYVGDPFSDDYLDTAIRLFKENNPDVDLELTKMTMEELLNSNKLATELAAGTGPDLVISVGYEFTDLYKTMDTGVFCDLEPFLQNDEDYNPDDYVTGVFDAGIYRGKRYLIPLSYSFPALVTTEEALEGAGIEEGELASYQGIINAAVRYSSQNPDTTAFYSQKNGLSICFPWSGVQFLDYENKAVMVDTDEFHTVMETYKGLYEQDWEKGIEDNFGSTGDEVVSLREGRHLFTDYIYNDLGRVCEDYEALSGEYTPKIIPLRAWNGEVYANTDSYGMIPEASENKANAYAFIKLMLSQEVQSEMWLCYPVRKSAVSALVKKYETDDVQRWGTQTTLIAVLNNMTVEEMEETTRLMTSVDGSYFTSNALADIVFRDMEPYFKGESDYESCLQKLENDLTIYISE